MFRRHGFQSGFDDLDELQRDDTIMLCGGIDVQDASTKKVLSWLRREARKGLMVGGLCTASYTLAKAGLLDGKRATIHWENAGQLQRRIRRGGA